MIWTSPQTKIKKAKKIKLFLLFFVKNTGHMVTKFDMVTYS